MPVIIYFLFFGFYFLRNYKKHGFNASSFLLSIYLVSSITACILLFHYDYYDIKYITFTSVIYHCICLFLFLSPVIVFANYKWNSDSLPNHKGIHLFAGFIIIFCLLSLWDSFTKLGTVLSYSDIAEARRLYNKRILFDEESETGLVSYFASFGHHFSFFAVFLFFIYSIYFPKYKKTIITLLIASLAIVAHNLTAVGRDGIVRWGFFFVFWFCYFKPFLSRSLIKKIMIGAAIILVPIMLVFIIITIARFSGRSQEILFYVLDYIGEPVIMFSYNFEIFFEGLFNGRLNFPIFFDTINRVSMNNLNETVYASHNLNTFPTFIGNFYMDFGFLGTFLFGLGFKVFSLFYFELSSKKNKFSKVIVFSIFVQIFLLGVFYYMFYSPTVFKSLILTFLISLIIQIKFKNNQMYRAY